MVELPFNQDTESYFFKSQINLNIASYLAMSSFLLYTRFEEDIVLDMYGRYE